MCAKELTGSVILSVLQETHIMDTSHTEPAGGTVDILATDSLPQVAASQVEGEAREHVATQPGALLERYRHGRVEAEAHRISEEVTKEAQARCRMPAAPLQSQQSNKEKEAADRQETVDEELTASDTHLRSTLRGEETVPAPRLIQRLLVPLDGTPEAERTLPYASRLARLLHGHLILGHVTPTADASTLAQALHIAGSDRLTTQQAFEPRAHSYLQDLRWRLSIPPEQVEAHHISAPSVADGLLELVAAHDIDLVIVGLRPHPGADHVRLGTVIDHLIRACATPVLLIPPEVTAGSLLFTLCHILVPVDGSALAEEALTPLLGLLDQTQGCAGQPLAVTLLRVAENHGALPACWSYLEALRDVLTDMPACARVQVRIEAIIGSAPGAIVGRIESRTQSDDGAGADTCPAGPVDLLIMATHGRGGLERLVLGSVADYVLPRVRIPVLLVHPAYLNL
jgi:nucleotide-binding universal stress UspA family protein